MQLIKDYVRISRIKIIMYIQLYPVHRKNILLLYKPCYSGFYTSFTSERIQVVTEYVIIYMQTVSEKL